MVETEYRDRVETESTIPRQCNEYIISSARCTRTDVFNDVTFIDRSHIANNETIRYLENMRVLWRDGTDHGGAILTQYCI